MSEKKPPQRSKTRWGSTYLQMEWFNKYKTVVQLYCLNHPKNCIPNDDGSTIADHLLTIKDWDLIAIIEVIMQPFNMMTTMIQGSNYPTRNLALPLLSGIIATLTSQFKIEGKIVQLPPNICKARSKLLEGILIRFDDDLEDGYREDLMIATLFDPRLKTFDKYPTRQGSTFNRSWAIEAMKVSWLNNYAPKNNNSNQTHKKPNATKAVTKASFSGFSTLAFISGLGGEVTSLSSSAVVGNDANANQPPDQLEEYLAEAPVKDSIEFNSTGLLEYWFNKRNQWPELTKMARQFLGSPATSAGVERVFSAAGKRHDDLKKKTIEKTIQECLMAAFNTKLPSPSRIS